MKPPIPLSATIVATVSCLMSSCAPRDTIEAPNTALKYSFTIEIPVVRPSSWDRAELDAAVRKLSGEHPLRV